MYAIICFDRPDSTRLRDTHRAAHVQCLNANSARIVFGGPLKGSAAGPRTGALIVVNCSTLNEPEILIDLDPFYLAGVSESVPIRAFEQVSSHWRPCSP